MKTLIKNLLITLPFFIKRIAISGIEFFYYQVAKRKELRNYAGLPIKTIGNKPVKNILIYHISGMFYAGTEKNLQLIANELVSDYTVYFMYSRDNFSQQQKDLMDTRIQFIEFSYDTVESTFPHFIHGMTPHIKDVIERNSIDLIVTSSSGRSQYPFNTIRELPIIVINIFGSPSLQKNIISTVFISKAVQDYSEKFTGGMPTNSWAHLAVLPPKKDTTTLKQDTRKRIGLPENAFVFGRIGRKSDAIFDPIGIRAFKKVVSQYPDAHYLIMSPPPILQKIVSDEHIPNVHYMSDNENIWDFYYTLDALAHFRLDGESFGLNIAEAMYAGNPIISHTSHIWNAHLEYLTPLFSRVAQKDNVDEYASYMEEFITMKNNNPDAWEKFRGEANNAAVRNFSKEVYGAKIKKIIQSL